MAKVLAAVPPGEKVEFGQGPVVPDGAEPGPMPIKPPFQERKGDASDSSKAAEDHRVVQWVAEQGLIDCHIHVDIWCHKTGREVDGWQRAFIKAVEDAKQNLPAPIAGLVMIFSSPLSHDMLFPLLEERGPITVWGSVGIHPNHSQGRQSVQEDMEALEGILKRNSKVVAVGETGLDMRCDCEEQCPEFWDQHALEFRDQQEYFRAQVRLARKWGKPVVVHSRESRKDSQVVSGHTQGGGRRAGEGASVLFYRE